MELLIDTTNNQSVLVSLKLENGKVIIRQSKQIRGSQALLGLIDRVLVLGKIKKETLKKIKVKNGPGSFTGLRVGISVANALGFALGIPINGKKQETLINYK